MKNTTQNKKTTQPQIQENDSLDLYKQLFTEFVEINIKEIGIEEENFSSNLQDLYFKNSTFPKVNHLVALKDQEIRSTILKPLFYRHLKDTVDEVLLWDHYIKLFDLILNGNEESLKDLDLPNEWVWDFLDEFIYQYQATEFNKSRMSLRGDTENIKKIDDKKWNIITIFNYLEKFIKKSEIVEVLSRPLKEGETILNASGYKHLLQLFGFMSLQGMFRLNCMIGDYLYAIQVAEPIINLGRSKNRSILSEITPICHIDTYYYISFSYMMIRRYNECITSLQYILSYIEKNTKYIQSRSYRYQQLFKKTEQLYSILIIVFSLSPQPIEFFLYTKVNEKGSEFMEQIREGDMGGFDQLFHNCAPKFISLSPIDPEVKEDRHLQTYNLQKELFLSDVQQQLSLPKISSYLKLYSSIEITKLAGLCGLNNEQLVKFLLSTKHKTRKVVDSVKMRGDNLGHFFFIKDMIHVDTNKRHDKFKKIFVDEFIGQSGKLQRIMTYLK